LSEEQRFVVFAMKKNQKPFIYNTINAKNWLIVYHLPVTITKKCLWHFQKCFCDDIFDYRRYRHPIFCQFMRNAFLGKVKLNQGKKVFRLKVIKKKKQ